MAALRLPLRFSPSLLLALAVSLSLSLSWARFLSLSPFLRHLLQLVAKQFFCSSFTSGLLSLGLFSDLLCLWLICCALARSLSYPLALFLSRSLSSFSLFRSVSLSLLHSLLHTLSVSFALSMLIYFCQLQQQNYCHIYCLAVVVVVRCCCHCCCYCCCCSRCCCLSPRNEV